MECGLEGAFPAVRDVQDALSHQTADIAMTHADQSSVPFLSSAHPAQALFGLLILLAGLLLVTAGCSSTHHVSRNQPNGYAKVTEAAAGETARVHLRDGRTLKIEDLYVGADSTSGILLNTPYGRRTFSTSEIRTVEFVNRGLGSVQGAGVGFGVPFGAGLILGAMQETTLSASLALGAGGVLAVPGSLIGAIIGAAVRRTHSASTPGERSAA